MPASGRPPTIWPVQLGKVVDGPYTPTDGSALAVIDVQLDGGPVLAAVCGYTVAHATAANPIGTYEIGDTVLVQVLPTSVSSQVRSVVYGVLMPA